MQAYFESGSCLRPIKKWNKISRVYYSSIYKLGLVGPNSSFNPSKKTEIETCLSWNFYFRPGAVLNADLSFIEKCQHRQSWVFEIDDPIDQGIGVVFGNISHMSICNLKGLIRPPPPSSRRQAAWLPGRSLPPSNGRAVFPLLALYLVNSHDGAVLGQLPLGIITCHFSSTKRGGLWTLRTEVVNIWDHAKLDGT